MTSRAKCESQFSCHSLKKAIWPVLETLEAPSAAPSGWHENMGQFLSAAACSRPDRALFSLSPWHSTLPIRLRMVSHACVFPGSSATFCESFYEVFSCLLLLHRIQSIRPTRQSHPTPP